MEGTTESQAKLEPRFRGRARAELGLLREEPGLEAREKREGWRKGKGGAENRRRLWQSWGWGQVQSQSQSQGPQL